MVMFRKGPTNYESQPIFFGESVSTARYDCPTVPIFEELITKQLAYFWRPEEVSLDEERRDFENLPTAERHIFISNLKYQTLLDSIQGRAPNMCLLPIVSIPEAETWTEVWSFSETIHSRSYTHILRTIMNNPEEVLDDITINPIIAERAERFTAHFDNLIWFNNSMNSALEVNAYGGQEKFHRDHILAVWKFMVATNALEAIAFYVSFASSFAFAENKKMEGSAKTIKLIAR